MRSRAPFALAVLLADLALYDAVQLVFFLRAHRFPDFLLFWAAARAALTHGPAAVYNAQVFSAAVAQAWDTGPPWPYLNPPVLAWLLVPVALLPFGVAFALWLAASTAALGWAAWRAGHSIRYVLSAFGFLPTFVALGSGQVAPLLTLALIAAIEQDRKQRPVAAGALLALLAVKPQLGLLLPVTLLASGRWRATAAAAAISAALAAITIAILGLDGTRHWLTSVQGFSNNPYFLRWSLQPLTGDTWWWPAVAAAAVLTAIAARRWRSNATTVYAIGLTGSLLINHYLTPSDLVILLIPVWALTRTGGRAAVVGGVLWAAGWLALFYPVLVIGAEALVLTTLALPVVRVSLPSPRLAPAATS